MLPVSRSIRLYKTYYKVPVSMFTCVKRQPVVIYLIIRRCARTGAFPGAFCVPNSVALASPTLGGTRGGEGRGGEGRGGDCPHFPQTTTFVTAEPSRTPASRMTG